MFILLNIFIYLVFLVIVFLIVSYFLSYQRMLLGEAPFVPVPGEYLPKIIEALGIDENSVVYDLGCGDGRVLFSGYFREPRAKYVGVEKSLAIFLCAWIRAVKQKNRESVKILRGDIFKENLSSATHVFTYLMPKMMMRLEPKLQEELAPGTRLVSCSFPLKGREASKTIDFEAAGTLKPTKLYIYDF